MTDNLTKRVKDALAPEQINELVVQMETLGRTGCGSAYYGDKIIARALTAIRQLQEAQTWRPIESAPKEHRVGEVHDCLTPIFLVSLPPIGALKSAGSRRVYEATWNQSQGTFTSVNGFIILSSATHWMPLPPAAIQTKEQGS